VKILLNNLMTMDYVRVRKSNTRELEALLQKRQPTDWHIVAAIFGIVVAVAIGGLVFAL